jgi:hypothetical protein
MSAAGILPLAAIEQRLWVDDPSFKNPPRYRRPLRIVLTGAQQLSLFNAHYDSRCFQPIHVYEATTSKPVAIILCADKTPDGIEDMRLLLKPRWKRYRPFPIRDCKANPGRPVGPP